MIRAGYLLKHQSANHALQIRGTNNKGKDFFRFNTQLTETIRKVSVLDKHIWSAGEYVHNHFIEGKDNAFYLSPDRINDAAVRGFNERTMCCNSLSKCRATIQTVPVHLKEQAELQL